jgi:hypothetical protein
MNAQEVVRNQRAADCTAVDGRGLVVGKRFVGGELPGGADFAAVPVYRGQEGRPLGIRDGLAGGP